MLTEYQSSGARDCNAGSPPEVQPTTGRTLFTVRAVVFDLDDTLLDTQPEQYRCVCAAATNLGLMAPPWERYLEEYGKHFCVSTAGWFVGSHSDWSEFRAEFERISLKSISSPLVKWNELLATLRALGMKVGIATNSGRERAERKLRSADIEPLGLDCLVCGDEVNRIKPAPDLLLLAQARLGISESWQLLYVGNAHADEDAAVAAGARFCAIERAEDWVSNPPRPETSILSNVGHLPTILR